MTVDTAPPPASCELCERAVPLTFHHLIPRTVHRKPRFARKYSKQEMRHSGLWICSLCHGGIHDLIPDEKLLGERYATREALLSHEGIARHVGWARKQK